MYLNSLHTHFFIVLIKQSQSFQIKLDTRKITVHIQSYATNFISINRYT